MTSEKIRRRRFWAAIPPWIIIGAVVILVPLFIFMTLENINRQKEQTTRLLVEKGAALIRSFEAGAR
ncbi:MAG: PAS domain-containing sensor histidine kinase, partial [Thermodesulfobacteriota bacterium]